MGFKLKVLNLFQKEGCLECEKAGKVIGAFFAGYNISSSKITYIDLDDRNNINGQMKKDWFDIDVVPVTLIFQTNGEDQETDDTLIFRKDGEAPTMEELKDIFLEN